MKKYLNVTLFAAVVFCASAHAAVSNEEASQLGTTLTPWGAIKSGNEDGTIPAYGADIITTIPPGHDPQKPGQLPDPFADDKPLFSITAANMEQYADKLSEGTKATLKKYPTMRVDVYPTRRTAAYPQYVIDNTLKNATACSTTNEGLKLSGCYGGLPFPIPKTGLEVMWNKLVRYTSPAWEGIFRAYFVDPNGDVTLQAESRGVQESPYYDPKQTGPIKSDEIYWRLLATTSGPARRAGEIILIHDSVDMVGVGRRAWQYVPGQRRTRLAPSLSYDTPNPQAGGTSTMDEAQGFLGAPDRYDWKLVGKKETYIAYNNFKFADPQVCPAKVRLTKNHPNPDCMRWELHRTWVVEGTLKPGFRHVYPKRVIYIDEDAPGAVLHDSYDNTGNLYRTTIVPFYPLYTSEGLFADVNMTMDLNTGAWMIGTDATDTGGWYATTPKGDRFFSPEALSGRGIR